MRFFALLSACLLSTSAAWGRLTLPLSMNSTERQRVAEVLGFGTGPKVLGNPYPLGGYSGVELGISHEIIPSSDLASFGNKADLQGETSYFQLSVSKGLFYDFDVFVAFIPMGQPEEISGFSGGLRWGIFEAEYLPIAFSLQSSGSLISFQNKINFSTQTLDGLLSFLVEDVSLYVGAGAIRTTGTFMGGTAALTDSGATETEVVATTRFLVGASVKFSDFFAAAELGRATDAVYSVKLGVRF